MDSDGLFCRYVIFQSLWWIPMDSDGFLRPGFLSLRFFAQTAPGFVHRVAMIARKRQRSSKLKLQRPQREASPLVCDGLLGEEEAGEDPKVIRYSQPPPFFNVRKAWKLFFGKGFVRCTSLTKSGDGCAKHTVYNEHWHFLLYSTELFLIQTCTSLTKSAGVRCTSL